MSETTTIFTIAQFALTALFAVLVIFGIIFGMRLKHRRLEAEAEVEEHREAASERAEAAPASDTTPAPETAPTPAAPASTTPPEAPPAEPATDSVATLRPIQPAPGTLAGDITQLKGLGPKLAAALAQLDITRVDQIAAMSPADLAGLDAQLGAFRGRPARDRWAEQARLLVAGDKAAYEAEFGKLG